jgi:hypothetical protein
VRPPTFWAAGAVQFTNDFVLAAGGSREGNHKDAVISDEPGRHSSETVGRIQFAGNHADNLPGGIDAATRSANRVAQIIHDA